MEIPLDRIPLFLRQDSVLPLGEVTQWIGERQQDRLELHVFINTEASFTMYDEDDRPWQFRGKKADNQLTLEIPPYPYETLVILYGEKPKKILLDEKVLPANRLHETQQNTWSIQLPDRSKYMIVKY